MTVYVCLGCDYEGDWITGIFSSKAAAEAHLIARKDDDMHIRPTRIEEYEVDKHTLVVDMRVIVTGR